MSCGDDTYSNRATGAALPLMGVERGVGGGAGSTDAVLNGAAQPARADEPPRKRPKLVLDEAHLLRKRLLESKVLRLKNLRDRFTEQLSELYFLQAGGNMMDYVAWRKRPPAQLVAFLESRRPPAAAPPPPEPPPARAAPPADTPPPPAPLAPLAEPAESAPPASPASPTTTADLASLSSAASPVASVAFPQTAEPKGLTVIANAPAAPAAAPAPAASAVAGAVGGAAPSAADEMVEKAKQEAYVAARVAELARAGLWAERRLPRVLEPPRPKTHWDYLLEEMAWLAQDFSHERKWKKQAAKKCARAVQKYFQDKALAAQKAEKAQEVQLKKIASFAAKEIRTFWSNVEKLVEWKRVRRVERARKEALDEQLSYIVDRTERYSRQLAANLGAAPVAPTAPPSDDEFQPRGSSDDDEETIAAAEREAAHDAADHRDELEALRRESRLALGELLPPGYVRAHSPPLSDYGPDGDSADDEDTIAEQELAERAEDAAAELQALRDEAALDLADLVRRYAGRGLPRAHSDAHSDALSDALSDAHSDNGSDADTEADVGDDEADCDGFARNSDTNEDDEVGDSDDSQSASASSASEALESLMETKAGEAGEVGEGGEQRVEAAASLAASLQPTGTTLSETAVGTPVPRLLRHALREYQHVGLHWLATMHARGLNGILADEMGLGKTIQSIALLAHLALERRDWGPHLVVAPTSVVLNWEMEFKKWCPAFKILTYYGSIKERKLKRVGWTKANSFHVCITSYKLVVQDHQSFRRKKWKYLILDEAQNIKNFKSQRWQMLLNFQTERRLLLTGTPLQNSLLELWSLMHFLMPDVFASHSEFREWFSPVAGLAEGAPGQGHSDALVRRLHEVLRPFLLRRLKADVERQMPRKYEHVLMCRLAKRQRFLYDDFMARAKTKESLASGNLLSVINVLMQLRKVCNHPDLFEPRAVSSPLQLPALRLPLPAALLGAAAAARLALALAARLAGDLAALEAAGAEAFAAHRARHLAPPRRAFHDAPAALREPRPPPCALRLHLRLVPRTPPALPPPPPPTAPPRAAQPARRAPAPAPGCAATARGAEARAAAWRLGSLRRLAAANERRCWRLPLYGADLRAAVRAGPPALPPRDMHDLLEQMNEIIDRFSICWGAARAGCARLCCGGGTEWRAWRRGARLAARVAGPAARGALALLHAPAARQAVAFPHPRLLQYDCGKLQTLDGLLRRLKAGGHRVLIFTQMTRVLDVLEAFLSMHGHAYLRLDGATRVDLRQPLVDRFNSDARVFAFILSTRSGGVGLNLTGADCVVFYDSDWNPTMDAQAQDRCHRIGQTRDVHVFRLVTAATVEENILRKAEQKRALGHLAIEDGHFTTSYLRLSNIKELFGGEGSESASETPPAPAPEPESEARGELECALAAAEDEADAAAARAARAEAQGELAEFDDTPPPAASAPSATDSLTAPTAPPAHVPHAPHRADLAEFATLMNQLTPIEKYAMRLVENSEAATEAERAALGEMRRQLHEWERARRALRDASPEPALAAASAAAAEPEPELTYWRGDARAKVWLSGPGPAERMPMWCPPTPPSSDGDVYCESWARPLYRRGAAAEALLPGFARRDVRGGPGAVGRDPRRVRLAPRAAHAPPSMFERGAAGAGGGSRARARPRAPLPHREPPQPEWAGGEDSALRRALRLQRLPPDAPAARAPNWDWVADLVNDVARAYRSPRACRDRHDALADPERARRKHKKPAPARRRTDDDSPRPPLQRLDAMREAAERRRAAPKRRLDDAAHRNPKHQALLADHGVDYDTPPTPMEVATRRAERIAKEKMKAGAAAAGGGVGSAPPAPVAPAAPPAPASVPQRIVLAAHAVGGAAGGAGEARRAAGVDAGRAAAQLVYRQQPLTARHHLKILHHAAAPHSQGGASVASVASSAGALQLQQLALRRAPPARPHLVLAQLAPAAHAAHASHASHAAHAQPPRAPHAPHVPHTTHAPQAPHAPHAQQTEPYQNQK